jgi:integrase
MAYTFKSLIEAMGFEPPAKGVKEIWHHTAVGFGIRIAAPTKTGKVRRTYLARLDVLQPDGSYKNEKPPLGLVTDIGSGDEVLDYKVAEKKASELVEKAKRRKAGGTVRLTVATAWELLHEELRSPASLDAPTYADKIEGIYDRFLSHLAPRYLDQLTEGFWRQFATQLRGGTLRVGTEPNGTPILRQAKSASYALAVFNAAARLYHIAHAHQGIEGKEKTWDPTRDGASRIEVANERDGHVHFEHLAVAWHATEQLISPWWRDLWRVYLLTGLRDRLVMDMRWDRLDLENGTYFIEPLQQGTKRRRSKLSLKERDIPIEMPLSTYVTELLRKRKRFAPDGNPWVWYSPEVIATPKKSEAERPPGSKEKRKPAQRLTDPRASWKKLTPIMGYWVYKHDLRRTYASIGATVDSTSVLALSLLLLHSSKTISKALAVPAITVKYIKAQQHSMRQTTERISNAVLELVGERETTNLTASLKEFLALPGHIEAALEFEEKTTGNELVYEGGDDSGDYE